MIRAYATDDPTGYGVCLSIVNQRDDDTHPHEILRIVGNENGVHHFHWTPLIPGVAMEPTLQIPGDHARAVYEALARHFQGTEDTRALRKDHDAERARVDELIEHLAVIAKQATAFPET